MKKVVFLLLLAIALHACKQTTPEVPDYAAQRTNLPKQQLDSTAYLLADSIIYDVVLHNPDSTNEWATFCVRNVDERKLADLIFDAIYAGRLQAFNYLSDEAMTIEDVRALEQREGNTRQSIRKMQFEEKWFFDEQALTFAKKVTAIMLAYEINGLENRYRAGIKVYLP